MHLENIYTECPKVPAKFIRDRFLEVDAGPRVVFEDTYLLLQNKDIFIDTEVLFMFHTLVTH